MHDAGSWLMLKKAGFTWRLRPGVPKDIVDRMLDLRAGNLAEAEVVKKNPSRAVFRLHGDDGPAIYAKWHRFRGLGDAILSLFRGTRAQREWRIALALERSGIRTPEVRLIGLRRRWGLPTESFLATCEAQGVALKEWAPALLASNTLSDAARRHHVAAALGRLVKRLHESGVSHPDLHSDNILVDEQADELCLLDLHAAKRVESLSAFRWAQNLAVLYNALALPGVTATDRLRFARAYLGPAWNRHALTDLSQGVQAMAETLRRRRIRSRSRRCVVNSSVYTSERTSLGRVYRKRAMTLDQIMTAIQLHRSVLSGETEGKTFKRDTKTNVTLIPWDGTVEASELCVKEFRRGGLRRLLPGRWRHQPAMAAWRASLGLAVRGVAVPEALALVMGKGRSSYIIMRALTPALPLDLYLRRHMGNDRPASVRRAFVSAAADFLVRCYASNICHYDLKARNILVHEPRGGAWDFFLLDLEAVRFPNRLPLELKLLNLAQLNASTPLELTWTDRMRFLRRLVESDPVLGGRLAMDKIKRMTMDRDLQWQR